VVGLVVALHQPRNAIGWIYLVVWASAALFFVGVEEYAQWAAESHADAPGETVAVWLGNWVWVPIFAPLLTFPFLLFPDGHLPSPRWRPVAWAIVVFTALWSFAFVFQGADYTDALGRPAENPFTPTNLIPLFDVARQVLALAVIILVGLSVSSLVVRYRRAEGDERHQIRWLMFAAGLTLVWLTLPLEHGNGGPADVAQGLILMLIPLSIGVAMTRYRLYDIDVVIGKAVVFGILAAFITDTARSRR
jgi:hypothetical protein